MHPLLNIAIQAIRNASKIILRCMDHLDKIEITHKKRNDVVTEVDRIAEQEIINTIHKAYPNHNILAEESGFSSKDHSEFTWVIDPLDGTMNYVHQFPQFATAISVKKGNETEVAVIYDPIRNEMFTAVRGGGARLNDRRLRVSQIKKMDAALLGTGFPFQDLQYLKPYLAIFENIFPHAADIRCAGSAVLDLAYVAAGRLDGFWEFSLKEWDMAAGALLIKEAGGMVSDFNAEENYLDNGNIIAGNPKIYKELTQYIQDALQSAA